MTGTLLSFEILNVPIGVDCPDADLRALVQSNWGHMARPHTAVELRYGLSRPTGQQSVSISRAGQPICEARDHAELLYELEADITIQLQQRLRSLYFLHSAAVTYGGGAYLFVAESGGGKSTTVWGLLHHGFSYLSDELAPVDLDALRVHAYPRALCLKRRPPPAYPLPEATVETPYAWHVPVALLPEVAPDGEYPLAGLIFVKYRGTAAAPQLRVVSPAEAGAHLYANALNQLAHANAGLDAAVRIGQSLPAWWLDSAELTQTCRLIRQTLPAP